MLKTLNNALLGSFIGASIGGTILYVYQVPDNYSMTLYFIACLSGAFLGILAGYKVK